MRCNRFRGVLTLTGMAMATLFLATCAETAYGALVAHYPLDTISGGTTPDSTGGTAGTLNGTGITLAGSGVIGDSFDFSGGTGQFVGIPNHPWGTTAFTASVWFNPDSLGNQGPLADWTNGGVSPQTFLIRTSGSTLQTYGHNGSAQRGGSVSFPSETLTTSDFNHVVLTYDGQRVRTYLNGELSTTVHDFGSVSAFGRGTAAGIAAIGGRGSSERDMAGLVDDVAFWGETLTDGKVAAIFNLADQPALNYDASQADQLFQVFDGALPQVDIGGVTWTPATGLGGAAGDVVDLGGGDFFVNLDGTAGVASSGGTPPPPPPTPIAQFDLNDAGDLNDNQAGWTPLNADLLTDSATQNGITFTFSGNANGNGRDRGTGGNVGASPVPNVARDFTFDDDGRGFATPYFTVTLDGLLPNTEYDLRWHHFENGGAGSLNRLALYQDSAIPANLLFETSSYGSDTTNYFTDFSATTDSLGSLTLVTGPHSGGRSIQMLNGFEVFEPETFIIPEPSTLLIWSLSLLGLACYGRRRKRS